MSLIKCSECSNEMSDQAPACPKCGLPNGKSALPASPAVAERKPEKWGSKLLVIFVVLLLFVAGGVWFIYSFLLPQREKDFVNRVASNTGVVVTPWIDRAEAAMRGQMQKQDQQDVVGHSIMNATHPTGSFEKLAFYDIRRERGELSIVFRVSWKGGGHLNPYVTEVIWSCSEAGHGKTEVIQDTAMIAIAEENKKQLDDWFKNHMWPVLYANTGGK